MPRNLHRYIRQELKIVFSGILVSLVLTLSSLISPFEIAAASYTPISLQASANANNGSGATSLTISKPTGTDAADVLVAQVVVRNPSTTITPPSGWSLIRRDNTGSSIADALYYHVATGSEGSNYTWTFDTAQKASGGIADFTGVDPNNPIDVSSGYYNNSGSTTLSAPAVTTRTSADELLFFGALTTNDTVTAPTGTTAQWTAATSDETSYMALKKLSSQGSTGTITGTAGTSGFSNISQLVALTPITGYLTISVQNNASANNGTGSTTLTIAKPSGVASSNVLVAQIVVGGSGTTITAPSGWSLIRRDNTSSSIADALYYKVAGGSEPSSYTWSFGSSQKASGGMQNFSNVDTATPIDIHSGNYIDTGSSTLTATGVNSFTSKDALLFFGADTSHVTVTSPSGMTSQWTETTTDTTSYLATKILSATGATGDISATANTGGFSTISQLVGLRPAPVAAPVSTEHYAPNANFDGNTYSPGTIGFNLVDIQGPGLLPYIPSSAKGLVYLQMCNGADTTFTNTVDQYASASNVWGFYIMDDPDPTGLYATQCTAANIKAESDYIHSHISGAKTMIVLMNLGPSSNPSYADSYTPSNSDVDYFGIDAYPCRSEVSGGCDLSIITKAVAAAIDSGIPQSALFPVYQTFGGGTWVDDGDGSYLLPSVSQEYQVMSAWASVLPNPGMDYAYSWGPQRSDNALSGSTSLQSIFSTLYQ